MNNGKRTKVVMLTTEKVTNIISINNKLEYIKNEQVAKTINSVVKGHHLYFISDEEIKEGNWFICTYTNNLSNVITGFEKHDCCKKIISSTDKSLKEILKNHNDFDSVFELPRPSDSFIQKYIEEYNKGNIIEEVLVEYNQYNYPHQPNDFIDHEELKVAPDNTITIKPLVETWSDIFNERKKYNQTLYIKEHKPSVEEYLELFYNPPTKIK